MNQKTVRKMWICRKRECPWPIELLMERHITPVTSSMAFRRFGFYHLISAREVMDVFLLLIYYSFLLNYVSHKWSVVNLRIDSFMDDIISLHVHGFLVELN